MKPVNGIKRDYLTYNTSHEYFAYIWEKASALETQERISD